jgi:dTDP-4-amino-4,6-dideoxygalactose transaminase
VQTTWYPPLSGFEYYRQRRPGLRLPRAEEAAGRHCALPMSSELSGEDVDYVLEAIQNALASAFVTRRAE